MGKGRCNPLFGGRGGMRFTRDDARRMMVVVSEVSEVSEASEMVFDAGGYLDVMSYRGGAAGGE